MTDSTRIRILTADGYVLGANCWQHRDSLGETRPVVVINAATSVRCDYYGRFATFLYQNGFDVITFDYRGIGLSRPETLRGFDVSWVDWGWSDVDAVLRYAQLAFPRQPIDVVAHSIGGVLLGWAPTNTAVRRVVTVGAQFAYWRDYAPGTKLRMLAKWYLAMPLIMLPFGYFPGKRLGWLEDTPRGIVRDWIFSRPRFENAWRGRAARRLPAKEKLVEQCTALAAPTLAVSVTDDEFGTIPAIERYLAYLTGSPRTHLRIAPADIEKPSIGHFGFFSSKFEKRLWPIALAWLKTGALAPNHPGEIISSRTPGG